MRGHRVLPGGRGGPSLEQRTYLPPKRQTLAEFLTDVWLPAIEHATKPGTFESYRRTARLHIASRAIGRRPLQEVEPSKLKARYSALIAGPATVLRSLSAGAGPPP